MNLRDAHLSDKEKSQFRNSILSLSGALVCLAAGRIYGRIFPQQDIVKALVYLAGIAIIGLPMLATAARGLLSRDMKYAMEILVSIAMIISTLSGQFLLAILIPVILTFVHFLEEKSIMGGREAIEGLKTMQAEKALVMQDGKETEVSARELKTGDVIIIKPGMYLPVDGEVIFGTSSVDQKSLTGESAPKTVEIGDPVFAGTVNIDGSIQVKVTKEYADTSFQKIVKLLEESGRIQMPDTQIVDRFVFYYIPLTLVTALLVWLFTQDITRAIAILVASCPCGLLLINSAPMIAVLAASAKRGILIKNSSFVEHLAKTDFLIFDKTGTITNGILEAGGYHLDGAADFNELVAAASCVAHASLHPISRSIVSLCDRKDIERDFAIKEHIGKGIEGKRGNDVIYLGSYTWIRALGYDVPDKYEEAGACDWVVKNGRILGCIVFKDTPRDGAAQAVGELKALGVTKTCLLTGDHAQSAQKIQDAVGIDEMRCDLLPEQKLAYVEQMMQARTVTFVGDGINDALALSRAHTGIAMGAMGSDTAIQSADIALMNNNLSNIPYVIKLAQKTRDIIYQNIVLAFGVSIVMIFLAGAGFLPPLAGAFFHNIGAFLVLLNSGRVIRQIP
jgi:Cd2+/Zn2+-exporting ATPase/Cu+-exporting ATPase